MNIVLVFDGLQIGGIERVGGDYVRLLKQLGHDVTIVNLVPKLNQMENEFPPDTKIVHMSFPRKMCPEQYAQLIKRNTAGRFIYPITSVVLWLADLLYKPIVCTKKELREKYDIAIAFSGHFNDLTFVASGLVRANKKMCWLHGALYGYLITSDGFYNLYKKIRNLVVLVDDAQDEALIFNHQKNFNIVKMYNPTFIANRVIDEDAVRALKEKYGTFLIMVSRFNYPHKDHYTVCDALRVLVEKYHSNVNLLFIGDGPEEQNVKDYVEKMSQDVSSHIHFMGARNDVQNYYKAAKMLVHASVAGEGLPTIMIEALAYQLPMVVTDSKVGPREILGNDEFGLLCKVQNSEDMAEKIQRLLTDEQLYKHYQDISPKRLAAFQPETISKQLKNVLAEI